MRAFVFTDRSLARYAGRFVWLAIDVENPANSAFLTQFPIGPLPMLLVVDSKDESIAARYDGGPTLVQLKQFLDDVHVKRSARDEALVRADRLMVEKKMQEAVTAYEEALASAP